MELKFRTLYANEIEIRVQMIKSDGSGCSLLLYQDARCGMNLLDEVVGPFNWQRIHTFKDGRLFCSVGVWDDDKKVFITKEDIGTESLSQPEKGRASDAFKRACVNWGIGRELYSSPFIWVKLNPDEISHDKKISPSVYFSVKEIEYDENRNINKLVIIDNKGRVRFSYNSKEKVVAPTKTPSSNPVNKEVKTEDFLTSDELNLITSEPTLIEEMKALCDGKKYMALSVKDKIDIAKIIREKMKEVYLNDSNK